MMTHRSWFPYILTGLSLALLAIIAIAYKDEDSQVTTPAPASVTAPSLSEYETAARNVVAAYEDGGSVNEAYASLVALRVPSEYQEAHLALVFAFADLKAGKLEEGKARLDVARTAYPWLATE